MIRAFVVLGVAGAALTAAGHPWLAQVVWIPANTGLMVHNWRSGQRSQAELFAVYLALCVWGVIRAWPWA